MNAAFVVSLFSLTDGTVLPSSFQPVRYRDPVQHDNSIQFSGNVNGKGGINMASRPHLHIS
jgi:hypothetical protein